jgi:hypothetical protein
MRVVLMAVSCVLLACLPSAAQAVDSSAGSTATTVTRDDLESIRHVAADHYRHRSTLDRAPDMAHDLGRVASFLAGEAPGCPCLGMWRLKYERSKWLLEREPPIDTLMFFFGVELKRDGTQWSVVRDFVREEHMQLEH